MPPLLLLDPLATDGHLKCEPCEAALSPVEMEMTLEQDIIMPESTDAMELCHPQQEGGLDHDMVDVTEDEVVYGSGLPGTDRNEHSTSSSQIFSDEEDFIDCDQPEPFSLFMVPPEIRMLIYEYLLLSDSAFRLGHHGPYSHETRRQLYPQILRTCRLINEEATEILYGLNTFFLGKFPFSDIPYPTNTSGPIGHKPTYSASFITSIGSHNALKIRNLAAHSTNPPVLTDIYLRRWIASFYLDVSRIRTLAISFNSDESLEEETTILPQSTITTQTFVHTQQFNIPYLLNHQGAPGAPITVPVVGSTPINPSHTIFPSTTINSFGTIITPIPVLPSTLKIKDPVGTSLLARLGSWGFSLVTKDEVGNWIVKSNTDLRAGDKWLLFVSPRARQRRMLGY
jgi:hypothetical protein